MNNISSLFENLMTYNEINNQSNRPIVENDSTLLNLTVELPTEIEDIEPEDVKVDVGVMNVDTDGVENEDTENDEINIDEDTPEDVTPDSEDESDNEKDKDSKSEDDEDKKPNKEEALMLRKEAIRKRRLEAKQLREANKNKECTGKEDCECEACKVKKEASDVETAKANIRKRVTNIEECDKPKIKKEALMHLDTKSLNKLMTEFVKENYKNIDKVTITKAMLENRMLKLEGTITNTTGESETISISNRGFDASKLEGKRFIMDFKDTSNTFGIIKESIKKPFVFTCTLIEGVLKFEKLQYSYKTMFESKVAEIYGKCTLTESKRNVKESTKMVTEDANQVKKFNEIVDKIKAAKSGNDLVILEDEMKKANLGDTLLAAAKMVWDDVNSRMVGAYKNK